MCERPRGIYPSVGVARERRTGAGDPPGLEVHLPKALEPLGDPLDLPLQGLQLRLRVGPGVVWEEGGGWPIGGAKGMWWTPIEKYKKQDTVP